MAKTLKYREVYDALKRSIQSGEYAVGDLLPSENQLCSRYGITRTTARKALDDLRVDGYIERHHGKGSIVRERRESLGLFNVKGFSEAVGSSVRNIPISQAKISWGETPFSFNPSDTELSGECIFFKRVRCIGDRKVMLEKSGILDSAVPGFDIGDLEEGSFFRTLSKRYLIEITGSEQEIRAVGASESEAEELGIEKGAPILFVQVRYSTSTQGLFVYSTLYCNTEDYPLGSSYHTGR